MASCVQTPTETVYSTFLSTTGGVITVTSTQIITGAPSTQSSFSTACIASASDGTCSQFTTETFLTTVPGGETTSTILQTITGDNIVTASVPVQTLFGSSCNDVVTTPTRSKTTTTTPTPTPTPTPDPTPNTSPTPNRNPSTPTPSVSVSLGQPTTITQVVVVTGSNGQVTTSASLITQTPILSPGGSDTKPKSAGNAGIIAGGVIAGFFGLILLAGLIWFFWKRRQTNWDDIFDKNEGYEDQAQSPRRSMNLLESEPKPYEYGVVGAHAAPGPPHSPGYAPIHGRTPSMAPLLLPGTVSEAGGSEYVQDGTTSTRSSLRYSAPQASNNTLSSFGYPPAQSPPFLQTNFAVPPHQRPASVSASSRNPSQSSRLSYPTSTTPAPSTSSQSQGHGRSVSAGQLIVPPRSPPASVSSGSHYSEQATSISASVSAGPSFAVQRKGRPQSYGATAIASSSTAPAAAAPVGLGLQTQDNVPPPAYEARSASKKTSGSIDDYVPPSMQGQRLALTNPDAAGPSSGPSSAKHLR